jgi:phosphoserine phosphatase RsbU/P
MHPQRVTFAELAIRAPNRSAQTVRLERERYELGRADSNALSFPDVQGLSRNHLVFERDGSNWTVRDAGSTNGSFVNGDRLLAPRILRPNDQVTAGQLTIIFSEGSRVAPQSSTKTVIFIERPDRATMPAVEATLQGVLGSDQEIRGNSHMKALIDAGRELCGHSSLETLFDIIMDLSMETVGAARGVLLTIEEGDFRVRTSRGAGFRISSHVRDLVVKQRRSLLVQDALRDEVLAARRSILEENVRSILAVPLQTEDRAIGLIYLDSPANIRGFTKDDLNVLTVLANIAAIRVEQARLAEIEQAQKLRDVELEHAARIQRSILPSEFPPFPHRNDFELHAAMVPAKEVGGDLFDFFLLDDEHLAFMIGDVSGKGVPAALFMAMTRSLLRATARHERQPGKCLNQMNTMLAEGNTSGMFVTLFYGVLDTRTGALEFGNAGHNPPYILSTGGKLQKLAQRSGPVLGVLEVPEYVTFHHQIPSGAAILLYTDGIPEAANSEGEFFEDPRLEAYLADHAAAPMQNLVAGLHAAVQEFSKGAPQADDITVLALRYFGGPC